MNDQTEVLNLKATRIGIIDNDYGYDSYYRVENKDGDLTVEQAEDYMRQFFYNEGNGPGTQFCTSVVGSQEYDNDSVVTVRVLFRYDV